MNVVSDLVGTRVTISMWAISASEMQPVITGIVRGVACVEIGHFSIMIEVEAMHRPHDRRSVGALSVFTLGTRGGCEIIPFRESPEMARYLTCRSLCRAQDTPTGTAERDALLAEMSHLWGQMSPFEHDLLEATR